MATVQFRMPKWQVTSLSRGSTDLVAALVPCSREAEASLKLATNRSLLCSSTNLKHRTSLYSGTFAASYYAKLSFAMFFGRRGVSIGSSRTTEIMLPRSGLTTGQHLLLHFDLDDATMLLTDTSAIGTWFRSASHTDWELLHNTTFPLMQNIEIRIGHGSALHFQLIVESYTRAPAEFERPYSQYVRSVLASVRWIPKNSKRKRSVFMQRSRRAAIYC
jgi:hypothetical protein